MDANRLDPAVRKTISRLPRIPFANRRLLPFARWLYNAASKSKLGRDIKSVVETHNGVTMHIYTPVKSTPDRAILWMFGGGHIAGKPEHLNGIAGRATKLTNAAIIVPNYRLAPKHPFPADLNDCFAAWEWIVRNAQARGWNINKLAVAGHSAGGGLAAALAQRIRDAGGQQPAAQCLFYPMLDDRTAANRTLDQDNHFIWNNKANQVAWDAYLSPNKAGAPDLPAYAAPARTSDLSGLPPAWIGHCGLDLFSEEVLAYFNDLEAVGVECELYTMDGVPHAFEVIVPDAEISQNFETAGLEYLNRKLS